MLHNTEKLNLMNSILAEIYNESCKKDVRKMFLNELRLVVPFSQASFWLHYENSDGLIPDPVTIDMSRGFLERYQYFADKDSLSWFYNYPSSIVYCGSEMLEDSVNHATDFYIGYLLPEKIAFSSGIVLIRNSTLLGTVNLFRTDVYGDFTRKELDYLEFFKPHIENIIHRDRADKQSKKDPDKLFQRALTNAMDLFATRYHISKREKEIVAYLCKGFSAIQISEELGISLSTVKKHINHIFDKAGIINKNQLFSAFLDCLKASIYS